MGKSIHEKIPRDLNDALVHASGAASLADHILNWVEHFKDRIADGSSAVSSNGIPELSPDALKDFFANPLIGLRGHVRKGRPSIDVVKSDLYRADGETSAIIDAFEYAEEVFAILYYMAGMPERKFTEAAIGLGIHEMWHSIWPSLRDIERLDLRWLCKRCEKEVFQAAQRRAESSVGAHVIETQTGQRRDLERQPVGQTEQESRNVELHQTSDESFDLAMDFKDTDGNWLTVQFVAEQKNWPVTTIYRWCNEDMGCCHLNGRPMRRTQFPVESDTSKKLTWCCHRVDMEEISEALTGRDA
jgi:hypothetical protein